MDDPILDCLIVGGGPAGLTAAIYLARFHLDILVVDGGKSRASWIPCTRNHAGFPDGINGEELLQRAGGELAGSSYAEPPAAADVQRFVSFLRGSTTRATPTLAVPGLSPHGQSRAFDFQVMRGSRFGL
jgi:choline dehydrogenase-like flavoprotein